MAGALSPGAHVQSEQDLNGQLRCDDATLHLESRDVMLQVNRYALILAGLENILNHQFHPFELTMPADKEERWFRAS
jgi:hypothetical protein